MLVVGEGIQALGITAAAGEEQDIII